MQYLPYVEISVYKQIYIYVLYLLVQKNKYVKCMYTQSLKNEYANTDKTCISKLYESKKVPVK